MKKLLSILSVATITGFSTVNLVSCSTSSNDKSKNLDNFKLNGDIILTANGITKKDVIDNIENQIQKYTNVNLATIQNDKDLWIIVEKIDDNQMFSNHDNDASLKEQVFLGNVSINLSIDKKDKNFTLNKDLDFNINIKENINNFNLNDISLFQDNNTNKELLNTINEQIQSEEKGINVNDLNNDQNYKYDVKESDGSEFNQDNITKHSKEIAAKGKITVKISFTNDSYIDNFNKTFTVNVSYKKYDLNVFKIKPIILGQYNNTNNDVLFNIYDQLAQSYEKTITEFQNDKGFSINAVITDKKGNKISFNNKSDKTILYENAVSGTIAISLVANDDSIMFYADTKNIETTIFVPKFKKVSLDKLKINDIDLEKEKAINAAVLETIERNITIFSGIDIHKIKSDNNLTISIIESDGTTFSTKTVDPKIINKKVATGKTSINISVTKDDEYFLLSKPKEFNINLSVITKKDIDKFSFSDIKLTTDKHSQYDLLINLEKQLASFTEINFNNLYDDIRTNENIYIKATTSDGNSIDTTDQSVITMNVPKGPTKIIISVNSKDKYINEFNSKAFNVNLDY